jgi:hypothetical protein
MRRAGRDSMESTTAFDRRVAGVQGAAHGAAQEAAHGAARVGPPQRRAAELVTVGG